jgi:thiamine biosynthesis lipoprotein
MRFMMNTLVTIKVYAEASQGKAFIEKGFAVFDEIEKISSFHLEQSETAALNRAGRLKPSSIMLELLSLSQKAYKHTEGYFDPTFAVLQKAYGFYTPEKNGRIPADDELMALLKHTGFVDKVKIPGADGFATIASDALVDFGGIAGGFAVQKAAEALRNAGCKGFLIDDAGDIWFEGRKPDGSPWRIAVRDPRAGASEALALIESFEAAAVSTSGNYERFVEVDGRRLGHIMDPFTGKPADHFQSVTVVASNPVDADVFSTALYAMPEKKALEWSDANNLPVLILTADNRIIINQAGEKWFKAVKK